MSKQTRVALIGNPNTGKTSIFNTLTGLKQKVGNYPGITVEKKVGICRLPSGSMARIIDLPGTYSLHVSSLDEKVVLDLLFNEEHEDFPDVAVVVANVENLKHNLLLFTQIKDLGIPTILIVSMADRIAKKGIKLNVELLEQSLKTKIAVVSTRKGTGIGQLKKLIENYEQLCSEPCIDVSLIDPKFFASIKTQHPYKDLYEAWLGIASDLNELENDKVPESEEDKDTQKSNATIKRLQQREVIKRYQYINQALEQSYKTDPPKATDLRARLDKVLTHRIWGYAIFTAILLLIFQAIFGWSSYPMDFIDSIFASLSDLTKTYLPSGLFTNLLAEGIIPGLGGIVIFIPQIAFLFLFISLLEESGYMSRVVFLMDRIMRHFGLSGKSVVPLISGTACAIPAVMATRNIESWKERLITILVTPFTTCSARLPVYLIIIGLVIPDQRFLGMNLQGLTLFALYLLGFAVAVVSAYVLHRTFEIKSRSFFVVEMPDYKLPLIGNVLLTMVEKTKSFVVGAGKIILAIAILLWIMASFGPGEDFKEAERIVKDETKGLTLTDEVFEQQVAAHKLEHSYIGIVGKTIEPLIEPLGYDWKVGIALLSSFAAREVFISTLATIYSVGSDEQETIKNRMAAERRPNGQPLFNMATGISLLLFYAFSMQCMSTLAIVKKETNSWKWPLLQLVSMTLIAYVSALIAYQVLK